MKRFVRNPYRRRLGGGSRFFEFQFGRHKFEEGEAGDIEFIAIKIEGLFGVIGEDEVAADIIFEAIEEGAIVLAEFGILGEREQEFAVAGEGAASNPAGEGGPEGFWVGLVLLILGEGLFKGDGGGCWVEGEAAGLVEEEEEGGGEVFGGKMGEGLAGGGAEERGGHVHHGHIQNPRGSVVQIQIACPSVCRIEHIRAYLLACQLTRPLACQLALPMLRPITPHTERQISR